MKKGFTIVELLAAIVILAVVIGIAVPVVNNISNSVKRNTYESVVKNIESAGSKYAFDTGDNAVFVDTLIKDGYLRADDENGKIVNPLNDTELNCYVVEMERISDYYKAKLTTEEYKKSNGTCNLDKIKERNAEVYITVTNDGRTVSDYSKWLKGSVSLKANSRNFNLNCTTNDCHWVSNRGDDARGISYNISNTNVVVNSLFNFQVLLGSGDNLKRYQASVSVKIDNEKPIVDIETTKNTLTDPYVETKTKTIKINASDGTGSGIAKYYFGTSYTSCNNVSSWSWVDNNDFTITANGSYLVCAKDNVGNISDGGFITVDTIYIPNYMDLGGYSSYFKYSSYSDKVKTINFVDYVDTTGSIASWNVGDSYMGTPYGNIMAWLNSDGTLYIGSKLKKKIMVRSLYDAFWGLTNLTAINFNGRLDTSETTNMNSMFYNCKNLQSINLNEFDTTNVQNMQSLFFHCDNLTSASINSLNTKNVTNMAMMFYYCSKLSSLNIGSWNTEKVTDMNNMFNNCLRLRTLDLGNWNVGKVKYMNSMFSHCENITSVGNLGNWNTSSVIKMGNMFSSCLELLNLNVTNWKTGNVDTMGWMFASCCKLSTITGLGGLDVSKVTDTGWMFYACNNLDVKAVENWNIKEVTNMREMFRECYQIKTINLNKWDVSKVISMRSLFYECKNMTSCDISAWRPSSIEDLDGLFHLCTSLQSANLANWTTPKLKIVTRMFADCHSITSVNLSGWDTSNVEIMEQTFINCGKLTSLNLRSWTFGKVNNTLEAFAGMPSNGTVYVSNGTSYNWVQSKIKETNGGNIRVSY